MEIVKVFRSFLSSGPTLLLYIDNRHLHLVRDQIFSDPTNNLLGDTHNRYFFPNFRRFINKF